MSIKAIYASIKPTGAFFTAVIVTSVIVSWFVGITGHTGVVIAAVLPVVLTGVGMALYIPFREGTMDADQAKLVGILSAVFAIFIFIGSLVGNNERESLIDDMAAKQPAIARDRLLQCTWMERSINLERENSGLRPLDYKEVCP